MKLALLLIPFGIALFAAGVLLRDYVFIAILGLLADEATMIRLYGPEPK